jgi:hypothetical protein
VKPSLFVAFPVPTLEKFLVPVPDPAIPYLAVFHKNLKIAQNLAFSMLEAAYFAKIWNLIYDFFTFYYIL